MPRARSPNRERAFQLWQESNGKRELKDIAAELGVSPEQVRKWKHTDNWNAKREKGTLPKGKGNVTKRKRGGQPGNKNAVGNPGGGAPFGNKNAVGNSGGAPPLGNTNALKHGGYSAVFWDTLTEEEQALLARMDYSVEEQLRGELALLNVRERRIMALINKIRSVNEKAPGGMGLVVAGVVQTEDKRKFDSEEDKKLFESIQRAKIDSGKLLPGQKYSVSTRTEATYDVLQRLEEALTRCQAQKQRCIQTLIELQKVNQSADDENALGEDVVIYVPDNGLGADTHE